MTKQYGEMFFPSVAFLVCANRLVAVLVALFAVKVVHKKRLFVQEAGNSMRIASLLPAFTSTVTSWLQYASLWYITFPTQMVFRALKTVPIMLFGKVFLRKTYAVGEYVEAFVMTAAVAA